MGISKAQANELVEMMNKNVFSRIREALIKNSERGSVFEKKQQANQPNNTEKDAQILNTAGIEILPIPEKLEIPGTIKPTAPNSPVPPKPSILEQKLSAPVKVPAVKTEHSLNNITPVKPSVDPYREIPE
jgi:hypothetical protein